MPQLSIAETITSTTVGTSSAWNSTTPTPMPTTPPALTPPATNNSLFECFSSYIDYEWERRSADRNRTTSYIPYTTSVSSWWTWNTSEPFTTLCDGVPRAVNPPVASTLVSTTITDYNATQTFYPMPPLTHKSVDCNWCDYCEECKSLHQFVSWTSSVWSQQTEPRTPATLGIYAPCAPTRSTPKPQGPVLYPTAPASSSCWLLAPEKAATMFYWPITTVSGDFCKQDGITVTPTPTASDGSPNTAVYNGITFTSPSAYIKFDRIQARLRYATVRRGSTYTIMRDDVISPTITVHPTEVSSVFHPGRNRLGARYDSFSFNWADMNTVPYKVYSSADCWKDPQYVNCERVWHAHTPKVGIPGAVTKLRTEWEFCSGWGSVRPFMVPITAGVTTTFSAEAAQITGVDEEIVED